MGKIADSAASWAQPSTPKRTRVDDILDSLDDEDRAIVLGWLHDTSIGAKAIHHRLHDVDISCAHVTIHAWRHYNGVTRGSTR